MVAYTYYQHDPRVRREAEALVQAGHSIDIIALRDKGQKANEFVNGVHVVRVPLRRRRAGLAGYVLGYLFFLVYATFQVSFSHRRRQYNLIHVHNMPDFLVFCGVFPKLMSVPLILDVHDPMSVLFSSMFRGTMSRVVKYLVQGQEKISYRFADRLITVNEAMRQLLIRQGVEPDQIEVIVNLPDPALFANVNAPLQTNAGFTLIYAGTVSYRHRLDLAILAVDMLREEMPDLCLKIVGDGPDIPRLKTVVRKLDIKENVIFEGVVPLESVPGIVSACDAAVSPQEAGGYGDLVFPTKVAEALMMGLPAICAKTDSVIHYFDESILFYFDPGDAESLAEQIRLIRSNPILVEEKLNNAEYFLTQFNWEFEKKKLIKIVTSICAN